MVVYMKYTSHCWGFLETSRSIPFHQTPSDEFTRSLPIVLLSNSRRGVLDTTLWDKVFQWFATSRWFSPGTPVSSTNKSDRHDITEILFKVALNTINHHPTTTNLSIMYIRSRSRILPGSICHCPFVCCLLSSVLFDY